MPHPDGLPTIDELPFDPQYARHPEWLEGIEKVRAFEDEAMRKVIYELQAALKRKQWAKPTHPAKPFEPKQLPLDAPPGEAEELAKRYP